MSHLKRLTFGKDFVLNKKRDIFQVRPYDDKEAEEYKMVLYRFAERCSFHLSDIQVCFGFSEFGLVSFALAEHQLPSQRYSGLFGKAGSPWFGKINFVLTCFQVKA